MATTHRFEVRPVVDVDKVEIVLVSSLAPKYGPTSSFEGSATLATVA